MKSDVTVTHGEISHVNGSAGSGKTTKLMQIASYASMEGKSVLFVTLENTLEDITKRFIEICGERDLVTFHESRTRNANMLLMNMEKYFNENTYDYVIIDGYNLLLSGDYLDNMRIQDIMLKFSMQKEVHVFLSVQTIRRFNDESFKEEQE